MTARLRSDLAKSASARFDPERSRHLRGPLLPPELGADVGKYLQMPLVIAGTVVTNDFMPKNGVELPE